MKEKKERTEEVIRQEIRALYAERAKIRKTIYAEYIGKSYLVNEQYYFIDKVLDKGFAVLVMNDEMIGVVEMDISPEQWKDYEISNEKFVQALETRVELIKTNIKEKQ